MRLQPHTHTLPAPCRPPLGHAHFAAMPLSLVSVSVAVSLSLSVWFRKLSFCSSSPKRKSYFLLLCTLLFRLSPFPLTLTLSLSLSRTVSFCLPLARKQFGCNFCAKFMLFVPFVPRIWALFASAPCIRLTPACTLYLSLFLPLHRFVFTGIPVLSIRGNGLPLSLCVCECVRMCGSPTRWCLWHPLCEY